MTIGERIKQVRMTNGLSQEKFGAKIKIKGPSVSTIESGKSNASDQTISLICKEFGVSESWLRTGEGQMEEPEAEDEKIAGFIGDVLKGKPDARRRLISALARLDPEDWDLIERMIEKVSGDEEKPAP